MNWKEEGEKKRGKGVMKSTECNSKNQSIGTVTDPSCVPVLEPLRDDGLNLCPDVRVGCREGFHLHREWLHHPVALRYLGSKHSGQVVRKSRIQNTPRDAGHAVCCDGTKRK